MTGGETRRTEMENERNSGLCWLAGWYFAKTSISKQRRGGEGRGDCTPPLGAEATPPCGDPIGGGGQPMRKYVSVTRMGNIGDCRGMETNGQLRPFIGGHWWQLPHCCCMGEQTNKCQ